MLYWSVFDLPNKQLQLTDLEKQSEDSSLWDNREQALATMKKLADLKEEVSGWQNLQKLINDNIELAQFDDESLRPDIEQQILHIEDLLSQKEISVLLSGPYDKGNAILSVHAGAGGTDSQDWAAMLFRMYLRWADKNGFKTELLDQTEGEEAGIKSSTINVTGQFAYGYLKSEKGVHRLVRLSPFDAAHRRHTSFALVEVLPEVNSEDDSIQINAEDIRIDVYKSSGAGGQNVQKNATAVRITHFPTGIVVSCQNERSQMQNRENAMKVLRAKLLDIQREEIEKQIAELRGEYTKAEWGSQIRSYVLHPYPMVKDHRTEFEAGNTQGVLDGDLNGFIQAYLKSFNR
ncbi:MAG: peptide chain release factor 2 [Anaerolineae bacterium]|nr:peptide chain release factor 2 [Anaerolineae bacterium]